MRFCIEENSNINSAQKYLEKYINDLKVHFDLSEQDIKAMLFNSYFKDSKLKNFLYGIYEKLKERK